MNFRFRAAGAAFSILIAGVVGISQEKSLPSAAQPGAIIETAKGRSVGPVFIRFNDRLNQTVADISFPAYGRPMDGIFLSLRNVSAGNVLKRADSIEISIQATGQERVYLDDPTFTLELNGQKLINSPSILQSDQTQLRSGQTPIQIFMAVRVKSISYDDFVKMANAKNVRMQIGPTVFDLKENHLTALSALLRLIE